MVGPRITAAAAEAAVTAICDENSFPREIFDVEEDYVSNGLYSPTTSYKPERLFIHPFIYISFCDANRSTIWLFY
jgi:hypothetical protein